MKAAIFFLCCAVLMNAEGLTVIVSKKTALPALTLSQVRDIFLQKRRSIGDQKMIPVNVLGQNEARGVFEAKVLGMDRNRLNAYWVKQHFQGITPPLTQPSFESVKSFVENVEGAIGYIPSSMVDERVKGLHEF